MKSCQDCESEEGRGNEAKNGKEQDGVGKGKYHECDLQPSIRRILICAVEILHQRDAHPCGFTGILEMEWNAVITVQCSHRYPGTY